MGRKTKPENTLQKDFPALNEKNREKILEMTRFLVLTQEKVVPSMLKEGSNPIPSNKPEKQGLA